MAYKIISSDSYIVSDWTGGTTTELFIYPSTGNFRSGDFQVRCSIATVNVDESIFTSLKGVSRTLMVLKGNIELHHEGHHTSKLKPFEQDSFDGGWKTTSYGKVTDFNLMTKDINTSSLTYSTDEKVEITGNNQLEFIHVLSGELSVENNCVAAGESIVFSGSENHHLIATSSVEFVHVQIEN